MSIGPCPDPEKDLLQVQESVFQQETGDYQDFLLMELLENHSVN